MQLFNDSEFQIYRAKEIEEGVAFLRKIGDGVPHDYFFGAMEMLKRIISLPERLIPPDNESQKKQAQELRQKAFNLFEARMIRKFLEED